MSSHFPTRAASALGPAQSLVAITPNDAADLPGGVTRGLFVGVAGDVAVEDAFGGRVVIVSADSQYHPVAVRRVLAADTTATSIIALY